MASKLSGIELTRYDDLFKTDAEREADRQERIQIVSAAEVFPYSRQPYTIDRPTPDLVRLMDSIEHIGIAEPLIVRPRESGGYEIISGHRRDYCAKAVGLDTRPVIVRNYSDEEADILVVDYNINREDLLPSEKAKAYKLKLDAMKRQGQRTDLTSGQLGQKLLCDVGPQLLEVLRSLSPSSKSIFVVESLKSATRNFEKLLDILEFLLTHDLKFASTNFYIENGHVERRIKPLRAGHTSKEIQKNLSQTAGLGYRHAAALNQL